ncbi:MAG: amidase family protein [Bauldia sp.]
MSTTERRKIRQRRAGFRVVLRRAQRRQLRAGTVDFAVGSDTGGSVRGPASFCGIIGIRPTLGRISTEGMAPLAQSFDTVGWFSRTSDVFERVGAVLLGEDRGDHAVEADDSRRRCVCAGWRGGARRPFIPCRGRDEAL